jgi:transcriptional regulator with XRE-family HTH domain
MKQAENKHETINAAPASLGEVIRQARERHNISVRRLSAELHMHQSYISRVEAGSFKPSPEKLQRIAEHLDLDYNDLCALAGYQAPGLPNFLPYLRAKYDMTDEDARNLSNHFNRLRAQHGITERTNDKESSNKLVASHGAHSHITRHLN